MLLNKDYNKRPTIFEVTKIPCIKKKIHEFMKETNTGEEVEPLLDIQEQEETESQRKEDSS